MLPPSIPDFPAAGDESEILDQLAFALGHRDSATLAFVECASIARRQAVEKALAERLPDNLFYTFEAGQYPIVSLRRVLEERLPAHIREAPPGLAIVHVHGLDISLLVSRDGQLVPSELTAQLNLERELLFREIPYSLIFWGDARFFQILRREAPDLTHWVTYQFRFADPEAKAPEVLPALPRRPLSEKGDIATRRARIQELTDRLAHLDLNAADTLRVRRDRLNALSLRAAEYAEAFEYEQAVADYREAIQLAESVEASAERLGRLWFELGTVYRFWRHFSDAIEALNKSQQLASEQNYGVIDHRIGMIYSDQGQWDAALKHYQQALKWYEQTGNTFELGSIYHQIGMAYAAQRQWNVALEYYQQALKWENQLGNTFNLAGTYHQIGMLYAEQRQWAAALDNYQQALKWLEQVGNTFHLGSTYHQIGIVYAEQQQWAAALENYQQALKWHEYMGNTFQLGSTYYLIGDVYEEQHQLTEAIAWYEKAVANLAHYQHYGLPNAQASLARARAALEAAASSADASSPIDEG